MTKRAHGEGSYYQRPNGSWQYLIVVNGRRVSGSGKTQAEAKRNAKQAAALSAPNQTRGTLKDLVDEWAKVDPSKHGLRPTTRDQYVYLMRSQVIPVLGDLQLSKLTAAKVAEFFQSLDVSASTARSTYAGLAKVLDFAVDMQRVGTNVARLVKRPTAAKSKSREITQQEAQRLLEAAQGHRWEVCAWLAFGCGLRRGEILALRWVDVDLDKGELHVVGNLTRSSAGLIVGQPKTDKGTRRVPIPESVVTVLKKRRKDQAAERLAAGELWRDTGAVISTEIGGFVEPRNMSRVWAQWARKAKLPESGTHIGRHYAATALLASGKASVADVAAQLGHDPAVLLNTYAVAVADGQRRAADVLGASLVAVPQGEK